MSRVILVVLFALLPQWLWARDIPDFSANYLVKLKGIQAGELKRSLVTQEDGTRHFSSSSKAKGVFAFFKPDVVEEDSLFQLENNKIIPLSYMYQRTGGKKEKYLSLNFDWEKHKVRIDDKKHPWTLSLEENTLDKLVYQLALMSDLTTGQTEFNYKVADGGKLKMYKIATTGDTEVITTPLGKIDAIKLIRLRDKKSGRQTTLWCAPALNFLPIKLEHIEKDGTRFSAIIRRLKGIDTTSAFSSKPSHSPSFGIK